MLPIDQGSIDQFTCGCWWSTWNSYFAPGALAWTWWGASILALSLKHVNVQMEVGVRKNSFFWRTWERLDLCWLIDLIDWRLTTTSAAFIDEETNKLHIVVDSLSPASYHHETRIAKLWGTASWKHMSVHGQLRCAWYFYLLLQLRLNRIDIVSNVYWNSITTGCPFLQALVSSTEVKKSGVSNGEIINRHWPNAFSYFVC